MLYLMLRSVASPGTQVTIQFIAAGIEEAETAALSENQSWEAGPLQTWWSSFTNEDNHRWPLFSHDFFMGNNGTFATIREVSESSHHIIMGRRNLL